MASLSQNSPRLQPNPTAHLTDILRTCALLFPPGQVTELRALEVSTGRRPRPYTVSGYFDDLDKLAHAAEKLARVAKGVYVVPNVVDPALLARASNRVRAVDREPLTADTNIVRRRWLLLDADPVRASGISSTETEHAAGLARMRDLQAALRDAGWPDGALADSGNGAHGLYRIDLPNNDASRTLLEHVLQALAFRFDDEAVTLDQKVFNAGRIWKFYGSIARKGDDTADRPHRVSRLLQVPEVWAEVTVEQLQALAQQRPETIVPPDAHARGGQRGRSSPFDLDQWIATHGLELDGPHPWQGGRKWIFRVCPWQDEHRNRSAYLVQRANGAIDAGCHHNSCVGQDWHALRDLVEPGWQTRSRTQQTERPTAARTGSNGTAPPPSGATQADTKAEEAEQPRLIRNEHGRRISCQHNALVWLAGHAYEPEIQFDTFRQIVLVKGEPLTDDVVIELVRQMEASEMMHWADSHVRSAILSVGARQPFSSVTRWLDGLTWDGKKRVWRFFPDAYGAEVSEYTQACAEVFFGSAVARAYDPGCQADVTVVLIGDQGIGKSRGLAALVPEPSWFTDDLGGDLHDRKVGEGLQGKWLIEFSEFARLNRAALDVVKAFLSRRVDHYRPAYGHVARDFKRQCVFIGTTNNRLPLQDLENRRFMPVHCPQEVIDIAPHRDQLWAEAVSRYKAGEPWWIKDQALLKTVKERQDDARQHDEWEEILRHALKRVNQVTLTAAAKRLGLPMDRFDKSLQTRLGLVMKTIGFTRRRASTGDRAYSWVRESKRGTA